MDTLVYAFKMFVFCLVVYRVGQAGFQIIDWVLKKAINYFLGVPPDADAS